MTPFLLWAPVVVQMALIFGASSLSDPAPLMPSGVTDKMGHFIGYAILSVLLLRAFAGGHLRGVTWRTAALAVAAATLYGVSDEFHQRFVPGRTPDVLDVLADATGASVGALLAGAFRVVASRVLAVPPRSGS